MFSAGAWAVMVLPMALNCTAQWTVMNISSFFVENPCPPHTKTGGIPLMVASYRGEKPHTFRPDGFCYY